ncbi:nucleotidyltransferase family protein [Christensenella sp. MSJ-20]|uniref:tRNA(Met) cytidine acetate ligase n=1 Tax=Christensenella sp. MSJ-20 TaxID=2841518 RepID=UPI001C7456A8|nr:nucleotidyltransferase family protein [Christensenella sp. MSJ-20]
MVCGIICEYNPFHQGHARQIQSLKEQGHSVVCLMSGSFVQRGDLAIYDKWTRARWALRHGADLVLELPVIHTLQSAQGFARGAVAVLRSTGVVDTLCFGTECRSPFALQSVAALQAEEPPAYRALLRDALDRGLPYPVAMERATRGLLPDLPDTAFTANSLLGVEYQKALLEQEWRPQVLPFHRESHSASATQCRRALFQGELPPWLPEDVALEAGSHAPAALEQLSQLICYRLRTAPREGLAALEDVTEGLENRLLSAGQRANTLEETIELAATRRYTHARIRRILCCLLLDIKKADLASYRQNPPYLRLLGFRRESVSLVSRLSEEGSLPLFTKPAALSEHPIFQKEMLATELYAIATGRPAALELTTPLITL